MRFFFSHAGIDQDTAIRIKQGFIEAGAGIADDSELPAFDDDWSDQLQTLISDCSAALILIGRGSVSRRAKTELGLLIKQHIDSGAGFAIHPLLLPGVTAEHLPPFLASFPLEMLSASPTTEDYQRLLANITALREIATDDIAANEDTEQDESLFASEERLQRRIESLSADWNRLEQKLALLSRDHILETRSDEKLRLQAQIEDAETLRTKIERRLYQYETRLAEVTQQKPPTEQETCPFPGLQSFDEDTARFYFGRQRETLETLGLFAVSRDGSYRRWLQIDGPSGVGKSSLVKAGMIPAIKRGWIEEQNSGLIRDWRIGVMRPGHDPVFNLAVALHSALQENGIGGLDKIAPKLRDGDDEALRYLIRQHLCDKRFLLVVDQLEEIFTLVNDEKQRMRFDVLIAKVLTDQDSGFHLITTIRSDFMLYFDQLPQLEALLNERATRYYLKPVGRTGLRDVIRTPVRLAGLRWDEASLPERIAEDAAEQPGALPLVSNLLQLLWQRRSQRVLQAGVYQELGGVGGALAHSADKLLNSLGQDGAARARGLLLGLIRIDRDSPATRRTIDRETALQAAGSGAEAERMLARLSGGVNSDSARTPGPRLVVVSSRQIEGENSAINVVDLAHEALFTRWQTLRDWIAEDRDRLEAGEALEGAARHWQDSGRPRWSGLPGASLLKRYRRAAAPSSLAREFLSASRRLSLLWKTIGGVFASLLISIAAFGWWVNQEGLTVSVGSAVLLHELGLYYAPIPEMVEIQAGKFMMGSPKDEIGRGEDEAQHEVTINQPFWMSKYEVTFNEYDLFARLTRRTLPNDSGWGRGRRPVINVSWNDAVAYVEWLSEQTGQHYRLPTEAEWEYAARAGTTTPWSFDDKEDRLADYAWYSENSDDKTQPIGRKKANPWGLHDMHGNVYEWMQDCYFEDHRDAPSDTSGGQDDDPCDSDTRGLRGGSFGAPFDYLRSAYRFGVHPEVSDWYIGFRCVRVPPQH